MMAGMNDEQSLLTAYRDGMIAYNNNQPNTDNPNKPETELWTVWRSGWFNVLWSNGIYTIQAPKQ